MIIWSKYDNQAKWGKMIFCQEVKCIIKQTRINNYTCVNNFRMISINNFVNPSWSTCATDLDTWCLMQIYICNHDFYSLSLTNFYSPAGWGMLKYLENVWYHHRLRISRYDNLLETVLHFIMFRKTFYSLPK